MCTQSSMEKLIANNHNRYSIRVGRSKSATGPFVDKDGHDTLKGGGTIVYGSNHGVVYAPGGVGVLINNGSDADVLYYHYRTFAVHNG